MKTKTPINQLIKNIKQNRKQLSEELKEYKNEVLNINENKVQRALFLYPVSKEHIENANKEFVNIFSAMSKLVKYIIHKEPELLDFIGKSGLIMKASKKDTQKHCWDMLVSILFLVMINIK